MFFLIGCGGNSKTEIGRLGDVGENCQKASDCKAELHCFSNVCTVDNQIDGDAEADTEFVLDGDNKIDIPEDPEKLEDQIVGEGGMRGTCGPDAEDPMEITDKIGNVIESGWDFDCDNILDHSCTKYWYDSENRLTKIVSSGMFFNATYVNHFYNLSKTNKCWETCEIWLFYPELQTDYYEGNVIRVYGPDDDCDGFGDPRQTPDTDSDSDSDVCINFIYDGPARTLSNSGDDLDCNGIPDWRCDNMCIYADQGDYILATCGADINCKDPVNPGNCLEFRNAERWDLKEACYRFYDENNLPPPAKVKKLDRNGNEIYED